MISWFFLQSQWPSLIKFNDLKVKSKQNAEGGNPTIKKKSLAKLIEHKKNYGLCDIWRLRNKNLNGLLLHKNILQVLFNVDLTTYSFQILFKICNHDKDTDSYFNRSFSCNVPFFRRKRLSQRYRNLKI